MNQLQTTWKTGTNDGIFRFLWHYTPVDRDVLPMVIPDTMTYLHNRTHKWYFYSKVTKKFMKKKDQRLNIDDIEQLFKRVKNVNSESAE